MQTAKVWTLDDVKADWARVKCEVAYVRTIVAAYILLGTLRRQEQIKRLAAEQLKYSPDQPRVSAGQSGGGQRTSGAGGGGQVLSDATPNNFWQPGSQVVNNDGGDGSKKPGMGHNKPPSEPENNPEPPPKIPEKRPSDPRVRTRIIREVAKYIAKKVAENLGPGVRIGGWLLEAYPYIKSYGDPPKYLEELQQAASQPEAGYDIHHIVEQTPAENEGYARDVIDGRDNLVRVPTLKHWEITGWYARKNIDFDFQSPRT